MEKNKQSQKEYGEIKRKQRENLWGDETVYFPTTKEPKKSYESEDPEKLVQEREESGNMRDSSGMDREREESGNMRDPRGMDQEREESVDLRQPQSMKQEQWGMKKDNKDYEGEIRRKEEEIKGWEVLAKSKSLEGLEFPAFMNFYYWAIQFILYMLYFLVKNWSKIGGPGYSIYSKEVLGGLVLVTTISVIWVMIVKRSRRRVEREVFQCKGRISDLLLEIGELKKQRGEKIW